MPISIDWAVSLSAAPGPRISQTGSLVVDAYDKVSITLEPQATADVDLLPADAPGRLSVLMLSASTYDLALTYSADGGTTTIPLDAPLVLLGRGAVERAGLPHRLQFANNTTAAVAVDALIGRAATQ